MKAYAVEVRATAHFHRNFVLDIVCFSKKSLLSPSTFCPYYHGGEEMKKNGMITNRKETAWPSDCLRLDPENRLCSEWDAVTIRKFPLASWHDMGWQVLDDFCVEHIL